MARILFGVHGTGQGHAIRALTVARHYGEHDFLFVCHDDAARLIRPEFNLFECPNPVTVIGDHRVQPLTTALRTARVLASAPRLERDLVSVAEAFRPDVVITDYELFTARVARRLHLPCLSLDNQHALTIGRIDPPFSQIPNRLTTELIIRSLFSSPDQYLVTCFFNAMPAAASSCVRWTPPLLRNAILKSHAEPGEHVLAYQGYATFPGFLETLKALGRPVRVYGMGARPDDGLITFRSHDEDGLAADLASSAYVICGGGHTLISEALYLGKPVAVIPVSGAYEQLVNGLQIERCGYGAWTNRRGFTLGFLRRFEQRLDAYRDAIAANEFAGNQAVFAAIDDFIAGRWRCG
ncbi:MAG: hypothetical protein KDJ77_17395 [Rhodobiaceae bacterium]|nr:hypothetical protein [Rhodobiaceae bacterium]